MPRLCVFGPTVGRARHTMPARPLRRGLDCSLRLRAKAPVVCAARKPLFHAIFIWRLITMPIAFLTIEIRIEAARSLKDRRQVLRSLKDRLRARFNVSVAELDPDDAWQRATIGVAAISASRDYLDGLMKNVEREAIKTANNAGADVVDSFVDFV